MLLWCVSPRNLLHLRALVAPSSQVDEPIIRPDGSISVPGLSTEHHATATGGWTQKAVDLCGFHNGINVDYRGLHIPSGKLT